METIPEKRMRFRRADERDADRITALYEEARGQAGCTWDETYPNREILDDDLSRGDIFVMEVNDTLAGAISIDADPLTDALTCWSRELTPQAEIARVVVAEDFRGMGIAPSMFLELHKILKNRGCKSVHYLVSPDNQKALHAYEKLGYHCVGHADLYGHHWDCYETALR